MIPVYFSILTEFMHPMHDGIRDFSKLCLGRTNENLPEKTLFLHRNMRHDCTHTRVQTCNTKTGYLHVKKAIYIYILTIYIYI